MNKNYDYIFTGLGASGFSLLLRLIKLPNFNKKKVLLLDQDKKNKNDRTWCFWEQEPGFFESVVTKKWDNLDFKSTISSKTLAIKPYSYKMIKGDHFYEYCWNEINKHSNIVFKKEGITEIKSNKVSTKKGCYTATHIFNSAIFEISPKPKEHYLKQHFKGWRIKTKTDTFNPDKATLMDFRVPQNHGCTFVYVMPTSKTEALVEHTLFSKNILKDSEYDNSIKSYLEKQINLTDYEIIEEEFGVIPMTNTKFKQSLNDSVTNIGTASGQTKASTGYTFTNIQLQADIIYNNILNERHPSYKLKKSIKYDFFDSVLLNVLEKEQLPAWKIFHDMFTKLPAPLVLDFLDENTNIIQDLRIMASVDTTTFIISAMEELWLKIK